MPYQLAYDKSLGGESRSLSIRSSVISMTNSVSGGVGREDERKRGTLTHGSGETVADRNPSLSIDNKLRAIPAGPYRALRSV